MLASLCSGKLLVSRSNMLVQKKKKGQKILGPQKLIKIGSVAAEIFLIWTNVARTNVAWTNVIVSVEICSRWSLEHTF